MNDYDKQVEARRYEKAQAKKRRLEIDLKTGKRKIVTINTKNYGTFKCVVRGDKK